MNTNNQHPYNGWFSETQVKSLLLAVQVFANSNGGLKEVAGENYNEKAEVMMKAFCESNSVSDALAKFKTPLEEYELS